MKKFAAIILSLVFALSLVGCKKSMNYIISNETHFRGIVAEYYEDDYIVVTLDEGETVAGNVDTVYVPLQVENADSMTRFDAGDKVTVYYDECEIKTAADAAGESVNGYIKKAVDARIESGQ